MNVSQLLKSKRKELKLSVKVVIQKLKEKGVDIAEKTLYGWESGHRSLDADEFLKLCEIYGILSLDGVKPNLQDTYPKEEQEVQNMIEKYRSLDGHGKKMVDLVLDGEAERMVAEKEKPVPEVKVYDLIEYLAPVSAGHGVMLDGSGEYFHYNVVANRYTEKADYTVRVQGQSMEPRFYDGDRLLVEEAPDVDFGEVGIFVVNGQGYVKLKGETSLLSINPLYPGVTIDEYTDFRCVGRVVGTLDPSWVVE